VKFAFIRDGLAGEFPVGVACAVLGVSRSGFYAWRDRPVSARAARLDDVAARVAAVHAEHRGVYGSPRVHAALAAAGGRERCCVNTVAKVMRRERIRAKGRKAFVPRTTDSAHASPVADNLLARDFAAARPDEKWAADITYVPTGEGWLYVAGVVDLCTRRVVGWAMADHMETGLAPTRCGWRSPAAPRPPACCTTATAGASTRATTTRACSRPAGSRAA
jgi:transposase InsO family protein